MDLARAGVERRARCENRRAAHAGVAANHREAAQRALVGREVARRQERREAVPARSAAPPRARCSRRRSARPVTAPARSRPCAVKEAWLSGDERDRVRRAHRRRRRRRHRRSCRCRCRGRSARRAPARRLPCGRASRVAKAGARCRRTRLPVGARGQCRTCRRQATCTHRAKRAAAG